MIGLIGDGVLWIHETDTNAAFKTVGMEIGTLIRRQWPWKLWRDWARAWNLEICGGRSIRRRRAGGVEFYAQTWIIKVGATFYLVSVGVFGIGEKRTFDCVRKFSAWFFYFILLLFFSLFFQKQMSKQNKRKYFLPFFSERNFHNLFFIIHSFFLLIYMNLLSCPFFYMFFYTFQCKIVNSCKLKKK